jgi:hypothetical protein
MTPRSGLDELFLEFSLIRQEEEFLLVFTGMEPVEHEARGTLGTGREQHVEDLHG